MPSRIFSVASQASDAAAVATMVLIQATAAVLPAPSAEPALKPNQPNHSRPAPSMTSVRLCGRIGLLAEADPLAEHERQREAGGTGVDVHRRTAGEVDRLEVVGDPAADLAGVAVEPKTQCATGK